MREQTKPEPLDFDSLNDAQLKHVCGRLLETLERDEEPLVTEEDRQKRQVEDRELIEEAARQTGTQSVPVVNTHDAILSFLKAVADSSELNRQAIKDALNELATTNVKLDFGLTALAAAVLLPAIAAAIIRPKVTYSSSQAEKSKNRAFTLDVRGIPNIGAVLKSVLPFLK